MNITIPNDVQYIIDVFYNNGYTAFMVGGCIRDALLMKIPMDYDIATSAPPDITEKLFSHTIPTGIKHGTITVIINNTQYEITTFRTEGKYINNRKPDSVSFISDIKGDLSRRDFTINALAYNNREGLLDYFSGNNDLKNGIIRCVGIANNRFNEDALRILRAIRFSSQLDFKIESSTYDAIITNAYLINNISKERIRSEFSKMLLSPNPTKALKLLKDTNILPLIFPFDININSKINKLPMNLSIRLAYLFIYKDINNIRQALKELTFDKVTITQTICLVDSFNYVKPELSRIECKKLINKVGKDNINILLSLYEISKNEHLFSLKTLIKSIIENNEPLTVRDLDINGTILKNAFSINSGKIIGEVLNHLINLVINDSLINTKDNLLNEASIYIKNHSTNK